MSTRAAVVLTLEIAGTVVATSVLYMQIWITVSLVESMIKVLQLL
jgi:hypothetical protein